MAKITKNAKVIFGILLVLFLLIGGGFFLKWALHSPLFPAMAGVAVEGTEHVLNLPAAIGTPISIVLGENALNSTESLILAIAVFLILLVALADLIMAFSSFKDATAWFVAGGLAVIASVTRVVEGIVAWFGITAGIGALGIGLIIIWAVIVGVIMNFLVGWAGIKAMHEAKLSQAKIATATTKMRQGYGFLKGASDIVDKEKPQ